MANLLQEYRAIACRSCGGSGYHDDPEGAYSCGCNNGYESVLFETCDHCHGLGEYEKTIGGNSEAEADVLCECPHCDGVGMVEVDA